MSLRKYKIKNTNILHNGDLYKIGDLIELDDEEVGVHFHTLTSSIFVPKETN